jgi:hypothetical protein
MRRLAVILTAVATVTAGLLAVPAQAATLPSPATTAYAFFTAPRPGVDWGTRFHASTGLSGSTAPAGGLTVQGTDAAAGVESTTITPPTNQSFAVGTYPVNEVATGTEAGVSLAGVKVPPECVDATSGTLTVHEVTLAAGVVTAFAGSVRGNCGSGQPVFAQEIRWNSTVPMIVLTAPVSTSKSEVVTVQAGASAATFGQAVGSGTDAKLAITADNCSNKTVPANGSCTLTLVATPDFFGPAQDLITLPDGGSGRKIPVTVDGYDTATGAYTPLPPARLLDTRHKVGVSTTTPIGPAKFVDLQVTGKAGVPASGVGAVALNVTVAGPTSQGFVTIYPTTGTTPPTVSSVNFNAGWTGANLVTATLGAGGKVRVFNAAGTTHVIVDVVGYYHGSTSVATAGYGGYSAIEPVRVLDTRGGSALPGNSYLTLPLNFGAGVNGHVKAFAVNLTVTRPAGSGFLAAWDGDSGAFPTTSTLNFTTGKTVPNMAVVPTSACGADCPGFGDAPMMGVLNGSLSSAHVIVDLVGYYDDNTLDGMWRYRPLAAPTRIVNTKTHQGIPSALGPGATATVATPPAVTTYNSMALVTNTTANRPTTNTVLTLWNADYTQPTVSNLNPAANQLVSNMTITDLGVNYDFNVNNAVGTTNLVLDVAGTMETYPAVADPGVGAALRADGLSALRTDSVRRATGNPRAKAPVFTVTPVDGILRHR